MSKVLKFSIFLFLVTVLSLFSTTETQAANVTFDNDVQLDFTSVPSTLYVQSGSACDSLIPSTSTLLADVPAGSTFTIRTATYKVIELTPTGGTVTLSFDTSYFGTGYITQWTASSSVTAATVSFSVGMAAANNYHLVSVDGTELSYVLSDNNGLVTFTYDSGFSAKIFTIVQKAKPDVPSAPGAGASYTYTPTDTTAPTISQISASVSSTTATISWQTDESSISWLLYGTSTAYGLEIKTTTSTTSHSLKLTNLSASTTYHYQIKSKDSTGNIGTLTDKTFTTLALGEVAPTLPVVEEEEEEEEEEEVPVAKPISQMTITELQAEITRIMALITQLQAQLNELLGKPAITGVPADFKFEKTLKSGQVLTDVKYLQIVLNSDSDTRVAETGVGSSGKETNIFGPLTKAAVIKFQEKYASEILAPWGLTKGTGIVGSTTRAKLNSLLGR